MASSIELEILSISKHILLYGGLTTFAFGMAGNLLNILTFTNLNLFRNNQCVFYLVAESIANKFQLIVFFINSVVGTIQFDDFANHNIFWCKLRGMIIGLCTIISCFEVVSCAYDQYLSTSHHFRLRQLSTLKQARIFTIIIIVIATTQMIIFGLYLEIHSSICATFNVYISNYMIYFYYPVLTSLLPIFLASLFSILAYQNVRRIIRRQIPIVRRRLDQQLTAMVLIRVIIFVVFSLPYAVHLMYLYLGDINQSNMLAYAINAIVTSLFYLFFNLNYGISFYIFLIISPRFRRQVKYVLFKKCGRQLKQIFCSNKNQVRPFVEQHSRDSAFDLE